MGIGPDVASVDGDGPKPDWKAAVSSGHATFVIARGMEGTTPDPDWKLYQAQCKDLSIPVSPYLFLHFPKVGTAVSAPEVQIDEFCDFVGPVFDKTCPPPALDLEQRRAGTGLDPQGMYDWAYRAWVRLRQRLGCAPIVYTSAEYWADPDGMNDHPAPEMAASPGWWKYSPYPVGAPAVYDPASVQLVPPPAVPTPWAGQWLLQQYQLDAHHYPGLSSTCDLNKLHVLTQGATGATVSWLQTCLGGLVVDGQFGPKTRQRLVDFQFAHDLVPDGIFGARSFGPIAWQNPA